MDKQILARDRTTHFFSSVTVVLLQLAKGEVRGAGCNLQPFTFNMYFLVEYDAYSSLNISTYYILQLYHSDGKGFASAASH